MNSTRCSMELLGTNPYLHLIHICQRTQILLPSFLLLLLLSYLLSDQPPNPLVDKFHQSLTNTPIQFTDHPATPRQESPVNNFLPSMSSPEAYSNKTQSEESQSNPSSSRRLRSNSTALGTSTQDAKETLS